MEIQVTSQFVRARKKYRKKHYPIEDIDNCVEAIIKKDTKFLKRHKDHAIGSIRELHINRNFNDDWLLEYTVVNNRAILILIDTGNHQDLNRVVNRYN